MNKKTLATVVDGIVKAVAARNGLEESEALALVTVALKRGAENIVNSISVPQAVLTRTKVALPDPLALVTEPQASLAV